MKIRDISGNRYGKLLAVKRVPFKYSSGRAISKWLCICDCGESKIVALKALNSNATRSCGCLRFPKNKSKNSIRIKSMSPEVFRIYNVWIAIRQRCYNKNCHSYKNYGARGIYMDSRWNDFSVFLGDMGPTSSSSYIDRINSNGPYTKDNCRWVNPSISAYNRRHIGGKSMYRGVFLAKDGVKKWRSQISKNGKRISIGRFDTEIEAALAYNKEALRLYGENALINEINGGYDESLERVKVD